MKLVRGAYHPHELAAIEAREAGNTSLSISPDTTPPVWTSKEETDNCYNSCAKFLISKIKEDIDTNGRRGRQQKVGVLFGTHNWQSCDIILNELVETGLGTRDEGGIVTLEERLTERLTFGQLFGKSCFVSFFE